MKFKAGMVVIVLSAPLFLTGCINSIMQENSVLVSELSKICGAIVGAQAEQRISQEWAKYPSAEANRPVIEAVANVLLTNPDVPELERNSQYKQYLTCATGMLVTNNLIQ